MTTLGDIIREEFDKAGCEPVKFERPLKSVYARYKFTKRIIPKHLVERHQAIGWALGLGRMLHTLGKSLHQVKSLIIQDEGEKGIFIEFVTTLDLITFEENHEASLDSCANNLKGRVWPPVGYSWGEKPKWAWDTCERISPVMGFTQMAGDGIPTGTLGAEGEKDA